MITLTIFVLASILYAAVAMPYLRARQGGRKGKNTTTLSIIEQNQNTGNGAQVFARLQALSRELDSAIFSIRLSACKTASLIVEQLDFEMVKRLELALGHNLLPVDSVTPAALANGACALEADLAALQVVCALIEVGPNEPADRSREDKQFVSLLSRARKQLSILPYRMKKEKRLVTDTKGDLLRAQEWMELTSVIVRCVPLKMRFSGIQVKR